MILKNTFKKAILLFVFSLFFHSQDLFSQCFQIESILVDACDANTDTEGQNEMVRFKVGPAAINTSTMSVNWPSNSWGGLIQNATTATKVSQLNASIVAAGGCGQVLQPTGGVLPANATVILVTSYNFNTTFNSFGALTDTIYILFQNSNTTTGHFGNYGTSATRMLSMSFGSGCTDTVTYNRSLLTDQSGQNVAADGATVVFTPAGAATYINNGCVAPVQPFTVDAGPASVTTCAGNPVTLAGTAQGQQSVVWSASSGTFSNAGSLSTTYTPAASSAGTTVAVTLTATNSCGATTSDVINVIVNNATVPNFNVTPLTICNGSSVPTLNTTSPNGITGTWNPAVISDTASGNYVFTPNSGQCASSVTLNVTVTNSITPNFDVTPLIICSGSSVPTLATTSPNGITGTWNPAVISNTASGNYVFTPNTGQCASSVTLNVTVTNSITPNFNVTPLTICSGSAVPTLATTSPNGIVGTWNPAVISNTASGSYIFTPNAGQCASSVTLSVTITNSVTPNFNVTPLTICSGSTVPTLNTTSPNGITGTWNPAVISNTASGNYIFTPNAGQCASSVTLNVTVTNSITPNFNVTSLTICSGSSVPTLATTSPNGITGTWSPSVISNTASGNYVFTPNAGQCASSVTLNVTVNDISASVKEECINKELILQAESNSFDLDDADYTWKNANGAVVGSNEATFNVTNYVSGLSNPTFPMNFTVTISNGCEITVPYTVTGIGCNIPKGISPNNDGKNDEFDLTGLNVKELVIFNRYGTKVYSRSNYVKEWTGRADNGNELPNGTYYYVIHRDNVDAITGWVYINRQRN